MPKLCRIIDTDEERFPPSLLRFWKHDAEEALLQALSVIEQNPSAVSDFLLESPSELKRIVIPRFGFSFLAPENWSRWDQKTKTALRSHIAMSRRLRLDVGLAMMSSVKV